jgi:integrase/recombinase XerD
LDADVLTGEKIERLIRACSGRAPTGLRNRALVVLAWRSGLRISEVLALRTKDVDLDAGTIRVQHGKGDRYRVVGLDPGGAAIVLAWLNRRRQLGISNQEPLICTLQGGEVRQDYVRHLLPRLARKADITKRVHLHGLRHAYALELDREGLSLAGIRELLGHKSAQTTSEYLTRLGAGEAIDFAKQRSWQL